MNFRHIFLGTVLLLTLLGASMVSADTIVMDNYSFTIPDDGYTVVENDSAVSVYNNDECITIGQGKLRDTSLVKQNRVKRGLEVDEQNITFEGIGINQQKFSSGGLNSAVYTFYKNDKGFVISYIVHENETIPELGNNANPVGDIIRSIN